MGQQVITITADGTVSGLQRKPGQGIDLRKLGPANIKRASLIEWDDERQAWYIDVLQEAGKGVVTGTSYMDARPSCPAIIDYAPSYRGIKDQDDVLYFDEYDDAVKVEVAYLDALRLKGQF